jgi:hypothetical protein
MPGLGTKLSTSDTTGIRTIGVALAAYPGGLTAQGRIEEHLKAQADAPPVPDDCHLRGTNAVIGNHISATDGEIGHLQDLLVDDYSWAIRYLVVNTSNWWGGHRVLIAPGWIEDVSWSDAKVSVDLTRQAVKDATSYDSAVELDRQREQAVDEHGDRPGYWTLMASQGRPPSHRRDSVPAARKRRQG